jgi:hypothetical protein
VAAGTNHNTIRTFAINQTFEYMRQRTRKDDAVEQMISSALSLILLSAHLGVRPE